MAAVQARRICCASTGDFRERAGGARKDVTDGWCRRSDLAVPSCLSPTRSSNVGKQLSLLKLTISSNRCLPIARSMGRGIDGRMAGFADAFCRDPAASLHPPAKLERRTSQIVLGRRTRTGRTHCGLRREPPSLPRKPQCGRSSRDLSGTCMVPR